MKLIPAILAMLCTAVLSCFSSESTNTVNAILGDRSYTEKFHMLPDGTAGESVRIRTHLEYVEALLRSADTGHLTPEQKRQRARNLDVLHSYMVRGVFPRNHDYPGERRPCFIDRDGNLCAVGYLIAGSAGRELAESINARYQYAYLADMQMEELEQWVESSGLTALECAMIQPSYGYRYYYPDDIIEPGYAAATGFLTGANLAFSTLNIIQFGRPDLKAVPVLGFLTGAGSVTLGVIQMKASEDSEPEAKYRRLFSAINIGFGMAGMIFGTVNLFEVFPVRGAAQNSRLILLPVTPYGSGASLQWSYQY